MKIQITKATKEDIPGIFKLQSELSESVETTYLKERKRLIEKRGKFYSRLTKLSPQSKVLLIILVRKGLEKGRKRFSPLELEKLYSDYVDFLFLKKRKLEESLQELEKFGFVSKKAKLIILRVPYEELFLVWKRLNREQYDWLSKKEKLKRCCQARIVDLVAKKKDKILGYLTATLLNYERYGIAVIDNLIVAEKARRRQIGLSLIKRFFELCKKAKISFVEVQTPKENKPAIAFYKKAGFKRSKRVHFWWTPYKI